MSAAKRKSAWRDTSQAVSEDKATVAAVTWLTWARRALHKPLAEAIEAIDGLPIPMREEEALRQRIARGKVLHVIASLDEIVRIAPK